MPDVLLSYSPRCLHLTELSLEHKITRVPENLSFVEVKSLRSCVANKPRGKGSLNSTYSHETSNRSYLYLGYTYYYRLDAAKRQTAGIKFIHKLKIRFFRHAGATRCTDSRQTSHS